MSLSKKKTYWAAPGPDGMLAPRNGTSLTVRIWRSFSAWLPAGSRVSAPVVKGTSTEPLSLTLVRPISLNQEGHQPFRTAGGCRTSSSSAFRSGVWTIVEVVEARTKNGHVYLELSERNAEGNVLATARASIWANTASRILPEFERATGASIAPGIAPRTSQTGLQSPIRFWHRD